MLFVVFAVFVVCWTPQEVIVLMDAHDPVNSQKVNRLKLTTVASLATITITIKVTTTATSSAAATIIIIIIIIIIV